MVPDGFEADDYVDLVTGPMLEATARHSKWIDVFCEEGAFDADQSRAVLEAGREAGTWLADPCQPAQSRPRSAAGGGPGLRLGRSLHVFV